MKRILIYVGFFIGCMSVLAAFLTATTYIQLGIAIVSYPLLAFFAFKTFPVKEVTSDLEETSIPTQQDPPVTEKVAVAKSENMMGIADIDKRVFLKLIGGLGLSLFLFSIFNKKAEGMFFKSLPASGTVSIEDTKGKKIDPAQNHPTDGFRISEVDDNVIAFYGFTNKDGAWFIMREDADMGSFRYSKGDSNFPGNWTSRENLRYDYYNNVF